MRTLPGIETLWVYVAQSYTDPSMFISGRDYSNFEKKR